MERIKALEKWARLEIDTPTENDLTVIDVAVLIKKLDFDAPEEASWQLISEIVSSSTRHDFSERLTEVSTESEVRTDRCATTSHKYDVLA